MDLFEYRAVKGIDAIIKLATDCNVRASHMNRLVEFTKRPSTDLAHKFIAASGGLLTLDKLLYPSWEAKVRAKESRTKFKALTFRRQAEYNLRASESSADPEAATRLASSASRLAKQAVKAMSAAAHA